MPGTGNNSSPPILCNRLEKIKKALMVVWGVLILGSVGMYILYPERFTQAALSSFIAQYQNQMMLVYLLLSVLRGVFLLPSTPFILTGSILFPDALWLVLAISMAGVLLGAAMIFYLSTFLGFDRIFQKRYAAKMERVNKGMDRYGFWIVVAWAFFPVVPTDIIAYVASITRMRPWKFFLGIFLGEFPLVAFYVFTGNALGAYLF